MSLKLVPFESLGAVSYSPSIVAVAVSVLPFVRYSVSKNGVTLKRRFGVVQAPFDRSHISSYSSSIVTMAISCIVCDI